ncbi:MAG: ROK family protein [Isosphaeraceae bacterium]|nr:ROK family protein [Isosphaeraceae bacterium]
MAEPLLLGVEIGGTKLQLGLGHGDGRIVALERLAVAPAEGARGILEQMAQAIGTLLARTSAGRGEIRAVGVGFGGPVDSARGVVTKSHQIEGWEDFSLVNWFEEHTGAPAVSLHNDADTAGLAEARFGAGVGRSPVLYVTIGSGIGGGLIIDGKIYRGAGAGALEIGHLWVVDRSNCDLDVIRLEDLASGWAIDRAARSYAQRMLSDGPSDWPPLALAGGDPWRIDARHLAEAARDGDRESNYLLAKAAGAVANALNQAVTLLAPRRIILGGGVSLIGEDLWLGPIRQQLDAQVFPPFRGTFDLVPAALGETVVVQGALALARDALTAHDSESRSQL